MSSTDARRTESSTPSRTEASGSSSRTRGSKGRTDEGSSAFDWVGYYASWLLHWAQFEEVELTQKELDELSEYSCSEPTGIVYGKRWKKNVHAYNPAARGREPAWLMGEYSAGTDPTKYRTQYRRVQIVEVKAEKRMRIAV
jgi:hypothetical protein